MYSHIGNLVEQIYGRSGDEIDIGSKYQDRTRGFGELFGIGGDTHAVGAGESSVAFQIERSRLVSRLEVGNQSAVFYRYIYCIVRFAMFVSYMQTHGMLVEEVVGYNRILLGRGYLGIRLGAHSVEGPFPRSGVTRRVVLVLYPDQRSHHGQTSLAESECGRGQYVGCWSSAGYLDKSGAGLRVATLGIADGQGYIVEPVTGVVYPGILLGRGRRRSAGERPLPGRGIPGRHIGKGNLFARIYRYLFDG